MDFQPDVAEGSGLTGVWTKVISWGLFSWSKEVGNEILCQILVKDLIFTSLKPLWLAISFFPTGYGALFPVPYTISHLHFLAFTYWLVDKFKSCIQKMVIALRALTLRKVPPLFKVALTKYLFKTNPHPAKVFYECVPLKRQIILVGLAHATTQTDKCIKTKRWTLHAITYCQLICPYMYQRLIDTFRLKL